MVREGRPTCRRALPYRELPRGRAALPLSLGFAQVGVSERGYAMMSRGSILWPCTGQCCTDMAWLLRVRGAGTGTQHATSCVRVLACEVCVVSRQNTWSAHKASAWPELLRTCDAVVTARRVSRSDF
eukprot:2347418-Prymnesium_polylepis.1